MSQGERETAPQIIHKLREEAGEVADGTPRDFQSVGTVPLPEAAFAAHTLFTGKKRLFLHAVSSPAFKDLPCVRTMPTAARVTAR